MAEFVEYLSIYSYGIRNPKFFEFLSIFTFVSIGILFLLFFSLIIDSFKKKPLDNQRLQMDIVSNMMKIIYNLFYIPFASTMLTYLFCNNQFTLFTSENFCGSSKHYIYFCLSLIFYIILFLICLDFIAFGFSKNENISCSISKFVIKNGCVHFYLARNIIVILYFLNIKYNIGNIYFGIVFLLSLYNTYCFFIEHIYQNQQNLNGIFFFYCSLINFFSSFLLFIGVLFRKNNFKGLIYIFSLLFLLATLYIIFEKKQKMKINYDNLSFTNDLEIFNQLRLMLLAHESVTDRSNLFDLFSYFFTKFDFLLYIHNESSENKEQNSEEQQYFLVMRYFDETYKYFLNRFPQSVLLRISYSIFQANNLNRFDKSYIILYELLSCSYSLNPSQEFFVYRLMRKIEEKSFNHGKDKLKVSLKFQCNKLIDLISKVSIIYIRFWRFILNSSKNQDINNLSELGDEIHILTNDINKKISLLQEIKFKYNKIFLLYGYYVRDILNDPELSNQYFSNEKEMDDIFNDNYLFDIKSLESTSETQFIIVSGKLDNFGNIIRISLGICNLLGYTLEQLQNKNMNILLPDFLSKKHEKFLKEKFKKNQIFYDSNILLKNHLFFMKSSSKYIVPIPIDVGPIYDEDYNLLLFGKLNFENEIRNQNFIINYCHILTNEKFIIQNYSSNSLQILDISSKSISNNIDIMSWIKDFNELILKKTSKNNNININELKIGILKKFLLNGKKKEITWRNQKKYLITCTELKFKNQVVAFLFHFCHENLLDTQVAEINKRQILRALSSTVNEGDTNNKNSNEFPKINKNYIPEGKIIDINLDESKYFFKNDKFINPKRESVGDYFNRKFTVSHSYRNSISSNFEVLNILNEESNSDLSDSEYESDTYSNSISLKNSLSSGESKQNNEKIIDEEKSLSEDYINIDKLLTKVYKVKLDKIIFSVYNFSNNIIEDVNLVNKIGKVEDILKGESKNANFVQHSNEKIFQMKGALTQEQKIQIGKRYIIPEINKMNKKRLSKNMDYINERLTPKMINNSILMGIIWNIITILYLISVSSSLFSKCQFNRKTLLSLTKINQYLSDLIENIYQGYSFSFQIVLLQHQGYINYDIPKEDYIQLCRTNLLDIYKELIDLSYLLNTDDIYITSKTKKKINSFYIHTYFITDSLTIITLNNTISNLIREYAYSIYNLANTDKSEISFLNIDYSFIFFNTDVFSGDEIENYSEIYSNEYKTQKKSMNSSLWKDWGILTFFIIILFAFKIKLFINIVQEKEKYFKYFFKIESETIKSAIKRCEKFVNLNNEINSNVKNIVSTPKINIGKESSDSDSENENLRGFESNYLEDKYFINVFEKKNQIKKNDSEISIYDKKNLKKEIGIDLILICSLLSLILRLITYLNSQYNNIINYMEIYHLILSLKISFSKFINYIKILVIYQYYSFSNIELIKKIIIIGEELPHSFKINGNINQQISNHIQKYDLPKKSKNKYQALKEGSLCIYYENYTSNFQIETKCENFANNISNYGLDSVKDFMIHSLLEFKEEITYLFAYSLSKGYIYNEIIYGTEEYFKSFPTDEKIYEDYINHNPFNILNSDKMKDFSVLYQYVYSQSASELTKIIKNDIISLFDDYNKFIQYFELSYFILVFLFIFLFLIPNLYYWNNDINKSRRMLRIIPKDVLLELLTNSESEENIEKTIKKLFK